MIIRNLPCCLHFRRAVSSLALLAMVVLGCGCEFDNYMDPSKTGYFEFAPTTIPVIERLDVVEVEELPFGEITTPNAEDLVPSSLEYRLAPGDIVKAEIYELVSPGQMDISVRVIDQAGQIRLPTLGNLPGAGLTLEELQKEIEDRLAGLITDPLVTVSLENGRSFQYTVYGQVQGTGVYGLERPDFRVMNALAVAGGTASTTQDVYVIREVALNEMVQPEFDRNRGSSSSSTSTPESKDPPKTDAEIEELINQMSNTDSASPGIVAAQDPAVDLDDVESSGSATAPSKPSAPDNSTDADDAGTAGGGGSAISRTGYRYDEEKRVWVAVGGGQQEEEMLLPVTGEDATSPSYATRIIRLDYQRLARGDSNLNIVIRPSDRIYVAPPLTGNVYLDGEVARPGVYVLPNAGRLTLSRLVTAAGGLGQLAIPERVDLVRVVGKDREVALRVNLSAIRNRSEPDIYIQPDDHIIVGTNFWATPLAVVRNGFRASYGFGFLLDRNFGNDVFGAPPVNYVGGRGGF